MAIFTLIGGAIAGALGLGAATLFGVSVGSLIAGALAFGTQLALSYLNRPKKRTYSAVQGQKEYGARVPVWGLFGTGKVQGHHIYYAKWGSGNAYNADVFILSNGQCDGLEPEIYFYGKKHNLVARPIIGNEAAHYGVSGFDNLISIRFYDGRPGQGPDTKLVADTANIGQKWKATSVCAGMTYVVVERLYDSGKFDKGIPEFEFILRGLRLYDPRKDSTVAGGSGSHRLNDPSTWEFSENPALQRLNYQLGLRGQVSGRTLIGEGKSLGQLDLGSYFAAMNACDALRSGKATYRASLLVTGEDDHTEVLKEFDDAMAGYGMNRRGLSGVIAGAPQIPVMDIGPDDIDAGRAVQIKRRKSAFELYNNIGGQFISKEANWNPESLKPVTINADVAADGRMRQTSNDFLQVTDPDIAQYLLQIRYRQNRKGGSATIPVSRRVGFNVEEGNWITYAGLTWLVTGWLMDSNLEFTLTLAETGSDVYSSDGIEPGPIVIPPTPPVNPSLLTTVQNFTVEVGMVDGPDGYEVPALRFKWTPPDDPTITAVRFEYFEGDDPTGKTIYTWRTDAPESGEELTSANVAPAARYTARATIVTVPDRFKTWTSWFTTVDYTGDIYYPGLIEEINEHTAEMLAPMNVNIRDLIETARNVAREALNQDAGQYLDRQSALTKISSTYDNVTAEYQHLVEVATGPTSALGLRIETLEIQMPGKADAAVLDQALIRIDDLDGEVTAQGLLISGVEAKVDGVSASGLVRNEVVATEAGALSTIGLSVAATAGGPTSQAAILVSARSDGKSMIGLLADLIYFRDTAGRFDPFVIEGGTAYFNNGRIRNLNAINIEAKSLNADQVLQDGTLLTEIMAFSAVTAYGSGSGSVNQTVLNANNGVWVQVGEVDINNVNPNAVLCSYSFTGNATGTMPSTTGSLWIRARIRRSFDNSIFAQASAAAFSPPSGSQTINISQANQFRIDTEVVQGQYKYILEVMMERTPGTISVPLANISAQMAIIYWKR